MTVALVRHELLYAWAGPSLLITTTRGACEPDQLLSGYYFRETRFLRTLRLEINGEAPWLCEAASVSPDTLTFTYVHPEIKEPGGGGTGHADDAEHLDANGVPERALDVRVTCRVRPAGLEIELTIANRALRPLAVDVRWRLDADFADIQEAQANRREQVGEVEAAADGEGLTIAYGHPLLAYRTHVGGSGWQMGEGGVHARLDLASQERMALHVRVTPESRHAGLSSSSQSEREAAIAAWRAAFTRIEVPGQRVERVLANNIRDIGSFPLADGPPEEWLAAQAGLPLYPAFFGRDALTAGWMSAMVDRGLALDHAMTKLARHQGNRYDDWRDEQPGRLPQQLRSGPLALLDVNPYSAYYADFASPLAFVISLANLWAWTGDLARVRAHWDAARRILDWAGRDGDADGDGYLEYLTRSPRGAKNQGWKDSGDAIVYPDGRPVPAPIATCELQAYWYAAQELMSILSLAMGAPGDARAHRVAAAALKERFNRDWWVEEDHCFALALDARKDLVPAVTSNVGHCVAAGIVNRDHLGPVVGRLFAPDAFSGWGIRTLASTHRFYNPLSYHRGSVWAVEQGTIVFGLRRFGFDARALDLAGALFDLAQLYPGDRIPECVGGYARGDAPVPGAYPRANTPQLWNAAAFPLVVQSLLGLLPLAPVQALIVDPVLPSWMPELVVRGLRVGDATVSLRFWRDQDGRSRWDVLHKRGTLRVVRQPPPESGTGLRDRVGALLESLI